MNQSKIYVGNFPYDTNQNELEDLFNQFGSIAEIKLIKDLNTGQSKGFAFITFAQQQSAQAALALNNTDFKSRPLKVNMAKETMGGGGGGRRQGSQSGNRNRW